ncbi:MAG: ribosome maturation factor RimP [Ruminococcaceae bacterium]|nr:ribosome maturation factor RimP [Oscillospiraceae bacterium]
MAYNSIEQKVYDICVPIAEKNGLSIWDVEFKKEGSDYYLRVYVDKSDGVAIDDCEAVSRELSDRLDELDPISQAYMLEVCSAGLDRQLKRESDFLAFLGRDVDVKLYAPLNGCKEFTAELKSFENGTLTVLKDGEGISIALDKIASVRLAVVF